MDEKTKGLIWLVIAFGTILSIPYIGKTFAGGGVAGLGGLGVRHRRRRVSRTGQRWISKKIRMLRHEGYGGQQAKAIAYNMARARGFKVPAYPG